MFVITLANPKGGSGKTTTAMLLAEQIHHAGAKVAVLDCDPNQNIMQWAKMRREGGKNIPFSIEALPNEDGLSEAIEQLSDKADYLVIDLEGTASQLVTFATGHSDFVIIPFEPTPMEARQAARAVQLVRNTGKMMKRDIDHAILFTRGNAAFQTSDEKDVRKELSDNKVPVLGNSIVRRAAYTRIFREASLLSELREDAIQQAVGRTENQQEKLLKPIDTAIANARAFAQEVVNQLNEQEAAA